MAKLTVGRIVHALAPHQPVEVGHYAPQAAICTHLLANHALLRVYFTSPELDRTVKVNLNPEGANDGLTWRWRWPPRDP